VGGDERRSGGAAVHRSARQTSFAIEQGRYSPSLEIAFQIARAFKVPLDEVFRYPDG
jgi:DNA-binding XRE family transcriptional regulator